MADWFDNLARSLAAAGWLADVWEAGAARLLVVPRAARVIACQISGAGAGADAGAGGEASLFWHDPRLLDPAQADSVLAGGAIAGGDRLWIAPETAYMWKDLAVNRHRLAETGVTPAKMDPGDYKILARSAGHLRLAAEMTLTDGRTHRRIALRVGRQFDLVKSAFAAPGVAGLSFAIRNDLAVVDGDPGAVAGCWDLLQLPPTGTLVCPTVSPVASPRCYFDPFGPRHVHANAAAVSFLIDARRRIKMGLAPNQTTGRMAYYRRVGQISTLIVRLFLPQPGQPYVDLPVDEVLQGRHVGGDALQAYNAPGDGSLCGEMEYHDPAVIAGQAPDSRTGACVTHCLAGPDAEIRRLGKALLGAELTDLSGSA